MHAFCCESHAMFMSPRNLRAFWLSSVCCSVLSCRPPSTVAVHSPTPGPELIGEGPLALSVTPDTGALRRDIGNFRFVLPVEIHGRLFRFGADHGASTTMITDSTIEAV